MGWVGWLISLFGDLHLLLIVWGSRWKLAKLLWSSLKDGMYTTENRF